MPLHQIKKVSETTQVGIWKITETEERLILGLKKIKGNIELLNTKNEQRLKQWLATRLLISHFFNDYELSYDEYGKPHLNNNHYISISHSGNYVTIIINNRDCGIDIEKISPKVERIKHKFLSKKDLQNYCSLKDLTTIWCAKEALYKYHGKKEILFIEHLFISSFNPPKKSFTGVIKLNESETTINMQYEELEDYILVYTL